MKIHMPVKQANTLLEAVRAIPITKPRGPRKPLDAEVAVAWLQGQVTVTQVARAMGSGMGSQVYGWMLNSLREAHRLGIVRVVIPRQ